jgi:hypothetical protein
VMELVEGETLRAHLDRVGALGEEAARRVGIALGEALDHAHRRGVIHRDVKPHNVFVDAAGRIKLADFGQARVTAVASMTGTSLAWGTPEYMPPEAFAGRRLDARADLYALAVVLYEVATGRLPFTRAQALSRAVSTRAAVVTVPAASEPFARLIGELLAPSPDDRPEGAAAVVARLAEPGRGPLAPSSRCPGCDARLPPELPLCLSCGQTVARFAHTQGGRWSLVLDDLADDAETLGRLLDLLGAVALPTRMPIAFLSGHPDQYSVEERMTGLALPAVLFGHLDEATARALEGAFRQAQLPVRVMDQDQRKTFRVSRRWSLASSVGAVGFSAVAAGALWGRLGAGIAFAAAVAASSLGQIVRERRRVSQSDGLFRLRGAPAPVPAADGLLAALAAELTALRGREGRQWLGQVGAALFALVRSSEETLAAETAAAMPGLTRSLAALVRRLDTIDQELEQGSEAELLQQLARLERRLAAEKNGAAVSGDSRRALQTALDRRHRLEQERDRLTTTLGRLLGHLRETAHRLHEAPLRAQAGEELAEASALARTADQP